MSSFQVDLGFLASVHHQLNVIRANLESTPSAAARYEGALGSRDLEGDLERFFGDWSDYWNKMQNHIDNVLAALATALADYQGVDSAVAKAATPQAQPQPQGPP